MDNSNDLTPKPIDNKELAIVKPTERNIEIYLKYRDGTPVKELAEQYQVTQQQIYQHLNRVKDFLGPKWQEFAVQAFKLDLDAVKDAFKDLLAERDSSTVNNYLNKMVYPDRSNKQTAIQVNVNTVVNDMTGGQVYDSDVKVIDNDTDNTE